jgi:DNA-binding CsgD family transcriptional regulator
MREDLNALYLRHYAHNPYARAYQKLRPNSVAIGNRLVDVESIRKSAFYADICRPQQIENQLFISHARLQQPGGIGGIALFLSNKQSEGEEGAAQRLGRLAEHLSRAIDLTLLTTEQASGTSNFQKFIAAMPGAALLLDGRGAVIQTNAAADALLLKADGLYVSKADHLFLAAQLADDTLRLARSIKQALDVARGEDHGLDGTLQISRPSGLLPFHVLLTPLPPTALSLWDAVSGGARVMIQVVDPHASPNAQAERLQALVGLTIGETRVAALIAGGFNIANVARALGISTNTVKTHLTRCYDKTGVRNQAALTRLLSLVPASLT